MNKYNLKRKPLNICDWTKWSYCIQVRASGDILVISGDHVSFSPFVLDEVHFTVNKIKQILNGDTAFSSSKILEDSRAVEVYIFLKGLISANNVQG